MRRGKKRREEKRKERKSWEEKKKNRKEKKRTEQKRREERKRKRTEENRGEIYVIWCEENHCEYISVRKNEEKIRNKDREPHRKMTIFAKLKRGKDKIFTCMWY